MSLFSVIVLKTLKDTFFWLLCCEDLPLIVTVSITSRSDILMMKSSVWPVVRGQYQTHHMSGAGKSLRSFWGQRVAVLLVLCLCHLLVFWLHCLCVVCLYVTTTHQWCVHQAVSLVMSSLLAYCSVTVSLLCWFCVQLMWSVGYKGMW